MIEEATQPDEPDYFPGRKELEAKLVGDVTNEGHPWLVICTKPSRLTDPPTTTVYVQTELTRVPAKVQAERKALDQLKALGVRAPSVVESVPLPEGDHS